MTTTLRMPDGVALTAQQERQAWAAIHGGGSGRQLGARSGFRVGTPSNILSATSTTWTLGPCAATIDPGDSTYQGAYGWSSDSNITGTMRPANATYSRKDIVYIQVNDSSAGDGSGAINANPTYAYGPEDGTNALPTLPPRSFLLGTISVPVAAGGSPSVVRNPAVYVAAGGVLPVADTTEQAALTKYSGFATSRNGILEVTDGTNWNRPGAKVIPSSSSQVGASLGVTAFTTGDSSPLVQVGTKVVTTDSSGYFSIDYPQAFPNGVLAVVLTNGDSAQGRDMVISTAGSPFTQTLATAFGSAREGGTNKASATIRVNYVVYGW